MAKDITVWARSCILCQKNKTNRHVQTPLAHIPVPTRRFSHLHVDLVGPLPSHLGFTHLFTMIDRTSRWPEAVPMTSTTSEACARVLIDTWISRYGVPSTITSDRGAQFTASLWSKICSLLGINHILTTSYHPQSNGMVERFHRSLKTSLRAQMEPSSWVTNLPMVLLGLRSVPKEDTGFSSSEAVFGTQLSLPGEFIDSGELASSSTPHHRSVQARVPPSLSTAGFVFVREDSSQPPLAPLYRGPYRVLERTPKFFKLQLGEKTDTVSIDRLKPVFSSEDVVPESPPRRGCPKLVSSKIVPHEEHRPKFVSPVPKPSISTPALNLPVPTRFQPSRKAKIVPQPRHPQPR